MSRDNGKAPSGSPKVVTPSEARAALTPEQEALRAWTDLRTRWFASGFTGVDPETGGRLPLLPLRPSITMPRGQTNYTRGGKDGT